MPSHRLKGRQSRLTAVFLMLAGMAALIGVATYRVAADALVDNQEEHLRAIAELKAGQLESWLAERRADAQVLASRPLIALAMHQWQDGPLSPETRKALRTQLEVVLTAYDYASIELLAPDGSRLLAVGGPPAEASTAHGAASQALSADEPALLDLHLNPGDGAVHLAVMAAVRNPLAPDRPGLGAVVLNLDPGRYLFPLVRSWPGSSITGETLLVRRDGDHVLYLNELRQYRHSALNLRLPLATGDPAAARAVVDSDGFAAGMDYRGKEVLAASRAIRGTSWHLIAKVDRSEVFDPLDRLAFAALGLSLGVILLAGLVAWRLQRRAPQADGSPSSAS